MLDKLPQYIMSFGVAAVILGAVVLMTTTLGTGLTGNAANAVNNVTAGLMNVATQFGTIGTFVGIVVLIGVMFGGIYWMFGRKTNTGTM